MSLGFKKLEVWKLAMRLTDIVYDITELFPASQRFGLTAQLQRSAVSVPSNIAEGAARAGKKEFIHFLYIAKGSLAELETQLIIAQTRKYVKEEAMADVLPLIESVNNMIGGLIKSLNPKP